MENRLPNKGRKKNGQFDKGHTPTNGFKKGEVSNPNGPPRARVQLWRYICQYMDMTDKELASIKKSDLTLSQQAVLNLARSMLIPKNYQPIRDVIDRSEGKVPDHIVQQTAEITNAEAMEILREAIDKNSE